jgi:hypothetical protein
MLLCLAGYAGAITPRRAATRLHAAARRIHRQSAGIDGGENPGEGRRMELIATQWRTESLRTAARGARQELPPDQGQQTGSVIVNFEACSLTLGDEAADGTEPPELRLAILAGLGNSGSPPWV